MATCALWLEQGRAFKRCASLFSALDGCRVWHILVLLRQQRQRLHITNCHDMAQNLGALGPGNPVQGGPTWRPDAIGRRGKFGKD